MFVRYQHIEKYGNIEVEGIENGMCWIFPKLDGTSGVVWLENDKIQAGSRNKQLTLEKDNMGFYDYILKDKRIENFFKKYPYLRLYGEYLKPHSLKTYKEDAWNKFYIFDVMDSEIYLSNESYFSYADYKRILDEFNLDYISPLYKIQNPTQDKLIEILNKNDYLIQEGKGIGEGIIIKNYEYKNKFGRKTWAKIVTSDFKDKHRKEMGIQEFKEKEYIEKRIIEKFLTKDIIEKVYINIVIYLGEFSSKDIPRLLETVFYTLIKEESWNFLKFFKFPIINYNILRHYTIAKIKELKKEIF